jgi:hypothetical protein
MNYYPKQFIRALATLMIPCYTLLSGTSSYGNVPNFAKIVQIFGPNDLGIRRQNQPQRIVAIDTVLTTGQQLFMSGSNRTFAQLEFYDSSKQHMGLTVQTKTQNNLMTLYYFPCAIRNGDSGIIQWENQTRTNQTGTSRKLACKKGIRIQPGNRISLDTQLTQPNRLYTLQTLKQFLRAQRSRSRFQHYCTVLANSGHSWLGVKSSGDPCQEPLQQCQASGGDECAAVILDRWSVREQDLTATVACANNQEFKQKTVGSKMKAVVNTLWEEAQAQGSTACTLRVLSPKDLIAVPSPSGEPTLVEVSNAESCPTLQVHRGVTTARSAKKPEGVTVKAGQKYTYCGEDAEDKIETFDQTVESIELQVFRAPGNYQLCGQEQASGGQEGDRKIIQLTANEGEIRIDYDMDSVPDRLQVIYEGSELIDTGFVSGSNSVYVPFKGNSGQIEVVLTGNSDQVTSWKYTVQCPQ